MLKHIIVLTLCFMAYIIGNVHSAPQKRNFEAETSSSQPKHIRKKYTYKSDLKADLLPGRQAEFGRLVECYKQMYLNELAVKKPKNGIQLQEASYYDPNRVLPERKIDPSEFVNILYTFYNENNVQTEKVNGEILPMVDCEKLDTEIKLKAFKNALINEFVQNVYMQLRVNTLAKKYNNKKLTDEPLKTFVFNWAHNDQRVFLRSVSGFCAKYSSHSDVVFNVNNPQK